ncbi:MAG: glycosyltransferase family A protein [Bacteroidales bacterium]|nr:glycosyltransferase family A protein [Bacteroidales bacterium]
MEHPFFSVVIPLYQKEKFISRAIDSVVFQTYRYFELLVVDDGSTDNGPKIVSHYKDKRIRLIHQENQGVSAARNRGILEAKSDYIALLDADDRWEPDFLLEMKNLIDSYPDCGWYSSKRINYYKHKKKELSYSNISKGVVDDFFKIAVDNDIVHSSSIVVPKQVFQKIGGFDTNVKTGEEDFVMWTKIAANYKVCYTDRPLTWYFFDELNLENRLKVRDPDHFYDMLEEGNYYKNEFIADLAIHRGFLETIYGSREMAKQTAQRYNFTQIHKSKLRKLRLYNAVPQKLLFIFYRILKELVLTKRFLVKLLKKRNQKKASKKSIYNRR